MWVKIFHLLALLSFLNMLTFDKTRHMEMMYGKSEMITETLFEYILEDIMDMETFPSADPDDPEIVHEDYRTLGVNTAVILPVFLFLFGVIFSNKTIFQFRGHPNYFSKMVCEPGYYTFLYRLRPF